MRGDKPSGPGRPAVLELLLSLAVVAGGLVGLVPLSTTPFLLLIGVGFLRAEGRGWRDLGLARGGSWRRTLALGVGGGLLVQGSLVFLVAPWIERLSGEKPDLGPFERIEGNEALLAAYLVLVWTLAAFGEELVYRGTLARRVAELGGGSRAAWLAGLVLVNLLFALGHLSQGPAGVLLTGLAGLGFAFLYLASGRNLWVPIVAHGTFDTVGLVLLYLGAAGTR